MATIRQGDPTQPPCNGSTAGWRSIGPVAGGVLWVKTDGTDAVICGSGEPEVKPAWKPKSKREYDLQLGHDLMGGTARPAPVGTSALWPPDSDHPLTWEEYMTRNGWEAETRPLNIVLEAGKPFPPSINVISADAGEVVNYPRPVE